MNWKQKFVLATMVAAMLGLLVVTAWPQGTIPQSTYQQANNLGNPVAVVLGNIPGTTDPCLNSTLKSSVVINISSATTTQLVAAVTGKAVYVCGFLFTISQVVTTANTLGFEYGTGTNCGTGTIALTGLLGGGGIIAAPPITVQAPSDGTDFSAPTSNALCAVTAIGATGSFQGYLSYVQQ
jgi:hypothetical protein